MSKPVSYFTWAPEDRHPPVTAVISRSNTPTTARPETTRKSSDLALAARELTLAAQAAPSRPTSEVTPEERGTAANPVTPERQTRNSHIPGQLNSPFSDPKYLARRSILGRSLSAADTFPEDFYRSAGSTPVISRAQTPALGSRPVTPALLASRIVTPAPGSRPITPAPLASRPVTPAPGGSKPMNPVTMQRFLNDSAREPKPASEEIGLCEYEIQAQRLSMARLWAAKLLIEQAYEYRDLDTSLPKEEQLLYPWGNRLQDIMFQLTDVVTRLGNNKLVKDYEKAYTIPQNSPWYGRDFNKVVSADAEKMLSGVQEVADRIVREIDK